MLSSGLVAVSLLLATHGDEGSREAKFRGALVAQAIAPPIVDPAAAQPELGMPMLTREQALRQELVMLLERRPTLTAPIVFLSLSAASLTLSVVMFVLTFEGRLGFGAIATALLAVAAGAVAVAFVVVGLVMLFRRLHTLRTRDARIDEIENELAQPPATVPPAVWLGSEPAGFELARF